MALSLFMKRALYSIFGVFCTFIVCASGELLPVTYFNYILPANNRIILGQEAKLRLQINFNNFHNHCYAHWAVPPGTRLVYVGGYCPNLNMRWYDLKKQKNFTINNLMLPQDKATCYFDAYIPTSYVNQRILFSVGYHNYYLNPSPLRCNIGEFKTYSPVISLQVVPHPLSMASIPQQSATANTFFQIDLKRWIFYYQENVSAGEKPTVRVSPQTLDGLSYMPELGQLAGKPTRSGEYHFQVSAENSFSHTSIINLIINVAENPQAKPQLNSEKKLPPASSGEYYHYNLHELLETMVSSADQLFFRFDHRISCPSWLTIKDDYLEGTVPDHFLGTDFALVAHSNLGGDSMPQIYQLAPTQDPAQKPLLKPFQLVERAGTNLQFDIRNQVNEELSSSDDLQLIIDNIEPQAAWLHLAERTKLVGEIPSEVAGQLYSITLHIATAIGGNSDPVKIPLQIATNPALTPLLKNELSLPLLYPGLNYFFDFRKSQTVYPEYTDFPYEITLSDQCANFKNPYWLNIENNQLFSPKVPQKIEKIINVCLQIHNKPGGFSLPINLVLQRQ